MGSRDSFVNFWLLSRSLLSAQKMSMRTHSYIEMQVAVGISMLTDSQLSPVEAESLVNVKLRQDCPETITRARREPWMTLYRRLGNCSVHDAE